MECNGTLTITTPPKLKSPNATFSKKDEKLIKDLKIKIPAIEEIFHVYRRIGEGTFSNVFLASLKKDDNIPEEVRKFFAIKLLIPTSHPDRVKRELECLLNFGGTENVVGVELCLRNNDSVAFVMPFIAHERFHEYFDTLNLKQMQIYMKNLLKALKHIHDYNIIHRDVKPSNFLYDRCNERYLLVDFGLAQKHKLKTTTDEKDNPDNKINNKRKNSEVIENVLLKSRRLKTTETTSKTNTLDLTIADEFPVKTSMKTNNEELKLRKRNIPIGSICNCFGKPMVCNICLIQKEICASRAGTPGYRPPEVLLKYPEQTTAVDIWAVGVIFLSLLSGCYPFFKATDDVTALAEIITLFGDRCLLKTAHKLGRNLTICHKRKPLDLHKICVRLRSRMKLKKSTLKETEAPTKVIQIIECDNCEQILNDCLCLDINVNDNTNDTSIDTFPNSAYDLLAKLLTTNPFERITAEQALNHEFFIE